jgi:hypothetical protein
VKRILRLAMAMMIVAMLTVVSGVASAQEQGGCGSGGGDGQGGDVRHQGEKHKDGGRGGGDGHKGKCHS